MERIALLVRFYLISKLKQTLLLPLSEIGVSTRSETTTVQIAALCIGIRVPIKLAQTIYDQARQTMKQGLLTAGVLLYGALMMWIIVPSGPLPCKTTEPSQLVQPNITLGAWQVQFISERFCQCYESDNDFLRALPLLAAACVVPVLMVLHQMDRRYCKKYANEDERDHHKYQFLCYHPHVHQLPTQARDFLLAAALASYITLTLFAHREVYGFRPLHAMTANVAVHYTSTSLFFLCFTLLYGCSVLDCFWTRHRRTWVFYFHAIALNGILILSFLFALFAIVIERNGKFAILVEYILFGWIFLAVPVWLTFVNLSSQTTSNTTTPVVLGSPKSASLYKELSIYDLNLDIL